MALPAIEPMNEPPQFVQCIHTLNDLSFSIIIVLSASLRLSFSLSASRFVVRPSRPSVSLRSDINCLLPNLIRNFRRRGNLTSFLFSLARSRASCGERVSFPGFFYPRSLAESRLERNYRPRSAQPNQFIYRCVAVRTRYPRFSFALSFALYATLGA